MHRTATRLSDHRSRRRRARLPAHSSWTAPADAAPAVKWAGPDFDAARATCAYQHNQTDLEFVKAPSRSSRRRLGIPNLARGRGFMDYTDDACMD